VRFFFGKINAKKQRKKSEQTKQHEIALQNKTKVPSVKRRRSQFVWTALVSTKHLLESHPSKTQ